MRTTLLSPAAAVALGVAAFTPTTASAAFWHHGYHYRPHFSRVLFAPRPYAPAYASDACVYRKRVVLTPWGPRVRLVPVCY